MVLEQDSNAALDYLKISLLQIKDRSHSNTNVQAYM